ncbi:MAG: DUF1543 domain-containing protein [Mucilaginibacter polytrichastri]|nr:DUF1543 domain-containing protein [Mucilaginibacter polytrichastri]
MTLSDAAQHPSPKLFMILLGSKAPARVVEQHDYFFGIAPQLRDLIPQMRAFWPEAGNSLHIDGWREVTHVEGYRVDIVPAGDKPAPGEERLFFINLGGYTAGRLEEQHYNLLTVDKDRSAALKTSKLTPFFKQSTIAKVKGANAHIDEKYGIDVDDFYLIEDLLSNEQKSAWHIRLTPTEAAVQDEVHLGYFRLDKL